MYTGKPIVRREDVRLLRGQGNYVDDCHIEGMVHAALLRSAWPHARILNIETGAAEAVPGVLGVFTRPDFGDDLKPVPVRIAGLPDVKKFLQDPIAGGKVRFVGEIVAIVVATDRYIAEDALALIDVEVEDLPPVVDWDMARTRSSLLHEPAGTNTATIDVQRGDAVSAFKAAHYTRRERFKVHRHTAIPMETRGLLAQWDEQRQIMTIWGGTKVPFLTRSTLAPMLDLPEQSIVLKYTDIGGAFGVRGEFYPEDFLIPFLARKIGRPVKWIEDRQEHFLSTNHARDTLCELEIACDENGIILGLRGEVITDIGAYLKGTGSVAPARCAQFIPGPYRVANAQFSVSVFVSNKTPSGTYRGPGRVEANFFRERLIDIAAADLGIDPVEMRRRNLLTAQDMPYDIGSLVTFEGASEYDSGDYLVVFEEALRQIGWNEKQPLQGRKIDGWYHGIGLAPFAESSAGGAKEYARVRLADDGNLEVYVGSASTGQGHETVFSQICADELQLPMELIRVRCASTDELVDGLGTFHSRSTVMAGNAVCVAAKSFKRELEALASEYFGRPNVTLEWRDGAFFRSGQTERVSLTELASFARERGTSIDVTDVFNNVERKPFSGGTHAAHVAVDPKTGRVKIVDYVAVEDIGHVMNPMLAHGQALGAIVQGLGGTFLEHLQYNEEGQLLTASFADYLMPTATDFPNIRSEFMDIAPAPGNPLGAKGGGEGGILSVAAAIANAVSAALSSFGVQVHELPLTPPRLWRLVEEARASK